MIYTCDKCFKMFNKKSNYNYHLKRKIPCKPKNTINTDLNNKNNIEVNKTVDNVENMLTNVDNVDNMLQTNINKYECLICHKNYKERTGLYKHKKIHNNYEEEIKKNNESDNKNININIHDTNENIVKIIPSIINKQDLNNKIKNEAVNNVSQKEAKCKSTVSQKEAKCKPNVDNYICLICHKNFKFRQSLYNHKKKHVNYEEELKKLTENSKNGEEISLLKNKLEETKKEVDEIKQINEEYKTIIQSSKTKKSEKSKKEINEIIKNTNTTNNNTTNNTTNNTLNNTLNNVTVNNNYIVDFGEEDLSKLTIDDKREILNSGSQIYPTLISKIYLNENIPQNNCICITNLRSDDMLIMENGAFVSVNKKKTMDELLSNMSIFAKRTFGEIIKSKEEIEQDMNNMNEKENNMNEKEQIVNVSENYGLVKVINKIKKHKRPEIMLSEGQKENIKEQIMFVFRYDTTGEDEDAEGVIKCTPLNAKRYTQIKKDSEIKIYNFRNKINKKLIKN